MAIIRRLSDKAAVDAAVLGDDDKEHAPSLVLCPPAAAGPSAFIAAQHVADCAEDLGTHLVDVAGCDIPQRRATLDAAMSSAATLEEAATNCRRRFAGSDEGAFCFGNVPTFADAAIVSVVARLALITMGAGLDAVPTLWKLYEAACGHFPDVVVSLEEHAFDLDTFEEFALAGPDY